MKSKARMKRKRKSDRALRFWVLHFWRMALLSEFRYQEIGAGPKSHVGGIQEHTFR